MTAFSELRGKTAPHRLQSVLATHAFGAKVDRVNAALKTIVDPERGVHSLTMIGNHPDSLYYPAIFSRTLIHDLLAWRSSRPKGTDFAELLTKQGCERLAYARSPKTNGGLRKRRIDLVRAAIGRSQKRRDLLRDKLKRELLRQEDGSAQELIADALMGLEG